MNTYDVRIFAIEERKGKDRKTGRPRSTYRVRWRVAGKRFAESFKTRALAESFRSELISASRRGEAFDIATGRPVSMARELNSKTWYEHAVAFVDMKWKGASAKHRKSIAEALATVTPILLTTERGAPDDKTMRRVLITWVFNTARRTAGPPPENLKPAVQWLQANTVNITAMTDPALVRKALDTIASKLDGTPAAATTIARKHAVFYGVLAYGVELGHFDQHPMDRVKWVTPKNDAQVDRRVVVNPRQADALLAAVREEAPELEAFFGSMYHAALRPEEALHLSEDEYERPKRKGGWGWLHLTGATVAVGNGWGNEEGTVDNRGLKHRAKNAVRAVPASPALCALLDRHIEKFQVGPGQKLFVTRRGPGGRYVPTRGQPIPNNTYTRIWRRARQKALTTAQQRSPLAKVPYHLRHAAVSTWLNAGVPATQVAEWAGQSLAVLLRIYAKCIDGQEGTARRRMEEGYRITDDEDEGNESDAP